MDINKVIQRIVDAEPHYSNAEDYYEGRVERLNYSAAVRHALQLSGASVSLNYLSAVVDNMVSRLEISSIVTESGKTNDLLKQIWLDNELDQVSKIVHRKALIYGECYVMAWPDALTGDWNISYHSPKDALVIYDPSNPRRKLAAIRLWEDTLGGGHKMQVLTPVAIITYRTDAQWITEGTDWTWSTSEENEFGEVPMFHFRTDKEDPKPEHANGMAAQDSINKIAAAHIVTVDFQAFPQRYALMQDGAVNAEADAYRDDETEREISNSLKNHPGEIMFLPGVRDAGQWEAANPDTFWKPINELVRAIAGFTNTPIHYFQPTGNAPSGNSLRAAEAPLLKKVADRQISFGATWRQLFNFILKVEGYDVERPLVLWESVESVDLVERWNVVIQKLNAKMPFRQVMLEEGYDEATIERMMKWKKEQVELFGNTYDRTMPEVRSNPTENENNIETEDNNE